MRTAIASLGLLALAACSSAPPAAPPPPPAAASTAQQAVAVLASASGSRVSGKLTLAPMGDGVHGGAVDAGHYRSRGSAPHLRFNEDNVHAQRKQCNRYGSGNVVGYHLGLIERIGLVAVEALEADNAPRKYSADDLRAIKADYTRKARELEKARG